MNIPLLIFNVIFYELIYCLYQVAHDNSSASLGVGFAGLILIVIAPIIQLILWRTKVIKVRTVADKILFATATPLLTVLSIIILITFK